MKKIFFAALAILAMSACTNKTETTEANAEEATEQAASRVVVLDDDELYRPGQTVEDLTILDFNATWCGPCKMLTPVFEAASTKFANVKFVSVDIDKMNKTAEEFQVAQIPTVIFLKPDGTATQFVGTEDLLPAEKFEALVTEALK